jgi:hypothetical protein
MSPHGEIRILSVWVKIYQIRMVRNNIEMPAATQGKVAKWPRWGSRQCPEKIPFGGEREFPLSLAVEDVSGKGGLPGGGERTKEAKREANVSGILENEEGAGRKRRRSGEFLSHVVGKGVKMCCPSREDPIDGGTKLQANPIPEGSEIEVRGVFHKSFSGLAQGLTNLLALKKKKWPIDLPIFFRNSHEAPGPCSPKEIGQNGLDPVVFLVTQEEDRTGILGKVGIEEILSLLSQECFGDLWATLFDGARFSQDKSRPKPCRQTCDKVFVPGIFGRIGVMVEMEDVEGAV